jgi:branched-chain amino acid transport system ATP-binding protein
MHHGGAVLEARVLTRSFGGLTAVRGVSFAVSPQEIVAVIGPNGAGKTTLFNLITGFLAPTGGEVFYRGRRITGLPASRVASLGLIRTFQNLAIFHETTVLENVMVGCHRWTGAGLLPCALGLPRAAREDRRVREAALEGLALVGLEGRALEPAIDLPFGQQRLLEIARALVARPSVLLLDEPTAGLSGHEARGLVALIRRLRGDGVTFVVIEHNMDVVMETADRVVVLNHGELIAHGPPQAVQDDPTVIAAYLGEDAGASGAVPANCHAGATPTNCCGDGMCPTPADRSEDAICRGARYRPRLLLSSAPPRIRDASCWNGTSGPRPALEGLPS